MNELLLQYKNLLDFNDKMQKSNMKFVESYLKFQKRKKRPDWEQDCIEFLKGAICQQSDFMKHVAKAKALFGTPAEAVQKDGVI